MAQLPTPAELQHDVEQFLYLEAELLDDRRFEEWYALFAPDARYWAPTRANRLRRDRAREASEPGEVALFDFDHRTLGWRVSQLCSSTHGAEDPPSRTRHLVTNVRVAPRLDVADELAVRSNFLCYRNRLADEVDLWAGERHDVLRRNPGGDPRPPRGAGAAWEIARRTVVLDQNVVLSKNLSVFF
jgi:3-phenylpropionate/cinnamic acid dioxygenase small subunit